MQIIQKIIDKLDSFQRRHRLTAFSYAVIKKYGDDEAGDKAALFTYYAFLSLFPLLLIMTTVAYIVAGNHSDLQDSIIDGTSSFFPVLGDQLSSHISTLHKTGPALAIGILFTLYGTRGIADSFRNGVQQIWNVPKDQRDGFPQSLLKSLGLIIIGVLGFIIASVSVSLAGAAGHGPVFSILSIGLNLLILFWLFTFLLNACLPKHVSIKDTRAGAASAAIGLVILQALGGYLLTREVKSLDALYSYFAISLGLLFWIYLQAQVIFYSIEIASVKAGQLWPRSLSGKDLTPADKK